MAAIRGAICAENTVKEISDKACMLVSEIIAQNGLNKDDIEAVFFSVTDDLNACYPAKAVRERLSLNNVAFMCFQEMNVENSLPKCIRVCVFVPKLLQSSCYHCYLGTAAVLRSDLAVNRLDNGGI